jgi:Transposase zinc-binding domain
MLPVVERAAEQNHRCELADIFRAHGESYRRDHRLPIAHLKVMQAVERCRTAALGGHLEQCDSCGFERHRYHSMPSTPKGNAGLACQSAHPHSMGLFVMIAQPTKQHRLFARSNSAKVSVRLLSPFYRFSACSHFATARQLSSPLNSNAPRLLYLHHHGDICSAPCHGYNPHSQPSLLRPTL